MGSSIIQVDDQLPCVAEQKRADGSHLAFSRAKAGTPGSDVEGGGKWLLHKIVGFLLILYRCTFRYM